MKGNKCEDSCMNNAFRNPKATETDGSRWYSFVVKAHESNNGCEHMQQLWWVKLAPTHTHCGVLCLHTETNSLSLWELLFLAQSLKQSKKSLLDSSSSQGEGRRQLQILWVKVQWKRGLYLTLPLIKARLTNKMNHMLIFLKPQQFGRTS